MKRRLPLKRIALALILALVCAVLAQLYLSNCLPVARRYTFSSSKVMETVRIVQLTDLHNETFGEGNERLLQLVGEQEPDVILVTGDLIVQTSDEYETSVETVRSLAEIAPVYISLGNHEEVYLEEHPEIDLTGKWEDAGAVVLDHAYRDVSLGGAEVRIGGVYGHCYSEALGGTDTEDAVFLREFQDTDALKLLMSHLPVVWKDTDSLDAWDVDYVFAGHLHGGQVRLPLIGALYAPDQGFLPGRITGVFESQEASASSGETKRLILSSGLGSNGSVPRFGNRPEIVTVAITPEA